MAPYFRSKRNANDCGYLESLDVIGECSDLLDVFGLESRIRLLLRRDLHLQL